MASTSVGVSWCLQILTGVKLENTDVMQAMSVAMLQSLQALMSSVSLF